MRLFAAVFLASLQAAALSAAEPVPTLRYSGTLFDAQGRPLDGSYLLHFRIFDDASGPAPAWSESRYVRAQGGRFSALLGGTQRLPDSVLRGAYRLSVDAPKGMGWAAFADGLPALDRPGSAASAAPAARPAEPSARPAEPAGVQRELQQARSEADRARKENEENKRRLDALERAVGAPAAAPQGPRIYVAQKGDTLRTVAFKALGDERHWILVYQANSDRLQRAGELTVGQKLVIPAPPK
ncbi:MAG: hypothetical protein HY928_14285 [Elusimicrobia bacterium]|nr:hypothetical protein [Elusimicrobiota bacterium]